MDEKVNKSILQLFELLDALEVRTVQTLPVHFVRPSVLDGVLFHLPGSISHVEQVLVDGLNRRVIMLLLQLSLVVSVYGLRFFVWAIVQPPCVGYVCLGRHLRSEIKL